MAEGENEPNGVDLQPVKTVSIVIRDMPESTYYLLLKIRRELGWETWVDMANDVVGSIVNVGAQYGSMNIGDYDLSLPTEASGTKS